MQIQISTYTVFPQNLFLDPAVCALWVTESGCFIDSESQIWMLPVAVTEERESFESFAPTIKWKQCMYFLSLSCPEFVTWLHWPTQGLISRIREESENQWTTTIILKLFYIWLNWTLVINNFHKITRSVKYPKKDKSSSFLWHPLKMRIKCQPHL